jgi:hypothetical protein
MAERAHISSRRYGSEIAISTYAGALGQNMMVFDVTGFALVAAGTSASEANRTTTRSQAFSYGRVPGKIGIAHAFRVFS